MFPPIALRVMAGVARPVVVHSHLAGWHGPFTGHVVVGVDGSAPARAALEFGFAHAEALGQPLTAVTVAEGPAN